MIIGLHGVARSGKSTIAKHLEEKHQFKEIAFAKPIKDGIKAMFGIDEPTDKEAPTKYGLSYRKLCQLLGTEFGREMVRGDVWMDRAFEIASEHENVVFSDVRFDNEADVIRSVGGIIMVVVRPDAQFVEKHKSENGIVIKEDDLIIPNSGTISDLCAIIDGIV